MNLAPDTTTIEAQRNTELLLLDYLRSTNPGVYALWCDHPDHNKTDDDDDADSSATSSSAVSSKGAAQQQQQHQPSSSKAGKVSADGGESAADGETSFQYKEVQFHRAAHVRYCSDRIGELPTSLQGMYPSRPWVAYWCLQAADLLGVVESDLLPRTPAADITAFLLSCLSHDTTCEAELKATAAAVANDAAEAASGETARPTVGFAGGPAHQLPHLASSYAACCALAVLSAYDGGAALRRLPRAAIKRWLLTLRNDDGSFRVHGGGESDIRASYCAAVLTSLLALDDPTTFDNTRRGTTVAAAAVGAPREYVDDVQYEPVLTLQTARFMAACQTHEGGFTCSATASEAHGAYTQCGLAALLLMKQPHLVHQSSLRRWLAARQLNCEGGFNGRTNKLVDSCYSHWIGASHVLLRTVEAYTKCFTPFSANPNSKAAGEGEAEEEVDGDAASIYLLAREVALLHHAQLLDATRIQTTETTAWDRAEAAHFHQADLVDEFLSADDGCLRVAAAKQAAVSTLYDDIFNAHDTASEERVPVEGKGGLDDRLRAIHTHRAFLYADVGDYYYNQRKLQDYVLRCCQDAEVGGLMDKPGTAHDTYHTCYSLSGMSTAQNLQYLTHAAATSAAAKSSSDYLPRAFAQSYLPQRSVSGSYGVVLSVPGPSSAAEMTMLRTTNPIFNIHQSGVLAALRVWGLKSFL